LFLAYEDLVPEKLHWVPGFVCGEIHRYCTLAQADTNDFELATTELLEKFDYERDKVAPLPPPYAPSEVLTLQEQVKQLQAQLEAAKKAEKEQPLTWYFGLDKSAKDDVHLLIKESKANNSDVALDLQSKFELTPIQTSELLAHLEKSC
jgi:hypothetical protein